MALPGDRLERPRFCVIGAGNGGLAMAGHLGLMGFHVSLQNRSPGRLEPVRERGGVQVRGEVTGFGPVAAATTDMAEALAGCDVAMVVVLANGHRDVAEACAPHLVDGQLVVLNPGRTFGAIEFRQVLRSHGCAADVTVAEAQTLIYISRVTGPGEARIARIKRAVPLAGIPASRTPDAVQRLACAFPQFVSAPDVLSTSLDNMGAVLHPALVLLNIGRVESGGDFELYRQGVTEAVAMVAENLDRERLDVAAALGVEAMTARSWLKLAYGVDGADLREAMMANPGYNGILAPSTLEHRYVTEDVPMGLVPIASLGRMLGRPTPTMDGIIHLAGAMVGEDYRQTGRTAERLGIAGMSPEQLRALAVEGER